MFIEFIKKIIKVVVSVVLWLPKRLIDSIAATFWLIGNLWKKIIHPLEYRKYWLCVCVGIIPVFFPFFLMFFGYEPSRLYLSIWWLAFGNALVSVIVYGELPSKGEVESSGDDESDNKTRIKLTHMLIGHSLVSIIFIGSLTLNYEGRRWYNFFSDRDFFGYSYEVYSGMLALTLAIVAIGAGFRLLQIRQAEIQDTTPSN